MKRLTVAAILLMAFFALAASAADVSSRLERAIDAGDAGPRQNDGTYAVWVYFNDKNIQDTPAALAAARAGISERALARRSRVAAVGASPVDLRDVPVAQAYIDEVAAIGAEPRRQSRWINAASFNATPEQINAISALTFVKKVDLVAQFVRPVIEPEPGALEKAEAKVEAAREKSGDRWSLDYGASLPTLEQINVPPVHELGLSGEGVIIGQLDAGYVLTHESLQHIPILAQYDFVHDDDNVTEQPGDHEWQHRHGSQVLSTFAGYKSGNLVGPAYGCSVILAMTEDTGDETQIEEDNWVAGLEWVESLGADLVTSSLGYYYWYNFEDLDGNTAVTTIAGDMAVGRGLPVFTSAGNERGNTDHPHLTAPADGDSILAMAAVDIDGNLASFSSPGPTYDGRIKPDLAAHGQGVFVANYYLDDYYQLVDGTSFACPLVAGVGALMLERVPGLEPMQMSEAFRQTASQSATPDNDTGWGIIDAYAAVTYWGAIFDHQPLNDTEDVAGPYTVNTSITSRVGLESNAQFLYWRIDGGEWTKADLTSIGGDEFTGTIPGQPGGGLVEYYLEAGDLSNIVIQAPHRGDTQPWSFVVGSDLEAPSLTHFPLIDQVPAHWPPTVLAQATDNLAITGVELEFSLNDGPVQGPFPLTASEDLYTLVFPLTSGEVTIGDRIEYTVTATDGAAVPNSAQSGPWEFFVTGSLGNLLLIDNTIFSKAGDTEGRSVGTDYAQWLIDAGYTVETLPADAITGESLAGRDAVFLATDDHPYPVGFPLLRAFLVDYVLQGRPILVEGGSVAENVFGPTPDPDFAATVLRSAEFPGSWIGPMVPSESMDQHPLLVRPHLLPNRIEQDLTGNLYGSNTSDAVRPVADSYLVTRSIYNSSVGGIVVHDNNTAPEAGQVVYLTYALTYLDEPVARQIVENSIAYLLAREAPGEASISGTVSLMGSNDPSGVTVTSSGGQSTLTGPGGQYTLTGLHGSTYTVTAAVDGYGTASRVVELGPTEAALGIDLTLYPIVEVAYTASPAEAIPDFNTDGISSVITVSEEGLVNSLNIDAVIEHPSVGHLEVTLTSPGGTMVYLHNHTGSSADDLIGNWPANLLVDGPGSLDDFLNEAAQGDWTLHVADTQFGAVGTFQSWSLNLSLSPDIISGVSDGLPQVTRLVGNYPNPFNPETRIVFETQRPGPVVITVHDVRGHRISELVREDLPAGHHQISWDGRDTQGRSVASGLYFCRMKAGDTQELMKMMLVK